LEKSGPIPAADNQLNIAEILVTDPQGVNLIVSGVIATGGTGHYTSFPPSNLIDGNINNFAHTADGMNNKVNQWFRVDLGGDKLIGKVSIINSNINLNSKTVIWELKVKR
jgi:hypothetical protein